MFIYTECVDHRLVSEVINEFLIDRKKTFFVDLFVRVSNKVAINMYTNLGYIVYRTVLEYYSGDPDEDAFGEFLITICVTLMC